MRLTIAFCLFLSFFNTIVLFAESDKKIVPASKCAPLHTRPSDSIPIASLHSPADIIEAEAYNNVEDTILPPCDILFFKSGKIEYCKVIETTPTSISYKMCDYIDGPTIIVNKSTVQKVRYANGREETIITAAPPSQNTYVKPRADPLSKLALTFSLCGLLIPYFAFAGLILGIISLSKISRSKGQLSGKGTAIWAICISVLIIILLISTI